MKYCLFILPFALWSSWAQANSQETIIQLNWKAEPQFGGFYAASLSGSDQTQGFRLTPRSGGSGTPTIQLLVNGKAPLAVVSAEEILISNDKNPKSPVLALFSVFQTNPQMIMCHAERGFESLKELFQSPLTLLWQGGLSYAQFLKKKYPKAKLKFAPYSGGISIFSKNSKICQQGFITSEPFLANKAGLSVKTFLIADEGFNPYTTVLAARRDWIEKNKDLTVKVISAVRAGWISYLENPTPTNAHMNQMNPAMDLRSFMESAKAQEKLIRPQAQFPIGSMTSARWSALISQMRELKIIKSDLSPEAQFWIQP